MTLYIFDKIKQFKEFWYFLSILLFFIIGFNCNAQGSDATFEDSFEDYNTETAINAYDYWNSTQGNHTKATSTEAYTGNQSLSTISNAFFLKDTNYDFGYGSAWIKHKSGTTGIGFNPFRSESPNYFMFQIGLDASGGVYGDCYIKDYYNATSTITLKATSTLEFDTWYKIEWEYDKINNLVRGRCADSNWSEWIDLTYEGTISSIYINTDIDTNTFYLDDLYVSYDNSVSDWAFSSEGSYIFVLEPTYNEQFNTPNIISMIKDLDEFTWKVNYHISSTTASHYTYYAIQYVLYEIDINNNILATTTGFIRNSQYTASTTDGESYIYSRPDANIVEDRKGAYHGYVALMGYDDSWNANYIASDEVGFVVYGDSENLDGSSSWCENVCTNIASSSETIFDTSTYVIKCTGMKIGCYLFYPPPSVLNQLIDSWSIATSSFPVSVGYDIIAPIVLAGDITHATSTEVLAPLIWNGSTTGANLLTNDTLRQGMGDYLYNFYWTWSGYILWTLFYAYLLFRIISLTGGFHAMFGKDKYDEDEITHSLRNGEYTSTVVSKAKNIKYKKGYYKT
jgi:hypothetical protein